MKRLLATVFGMALLAGCAALPPAQQPGGAPATQPEQACGSAAADVELHLKLVQQMHDKGLFHAALAHLDALSERDRELPEARYLRAESLRRMGKGAEAEAIYRGLLGGCLQGLAHRGLGLLAAQAGRIDAAVDHLQAAREFLPTDPRVRNDLGYALLLQGDVEEARTQFMTALELGADRRRILANMVLLLFVADDEAGARKLAGEAGIDAMELTSIRDQAQELRKKRPGS